MPVEFTMPKLGLTMEEGTIVEWLVPDGAPVTAGTAVVLIETDKVQTEVEVPSAGRLVPTAPVGTTHRCGEPIGWLLGPDETPPTGASAPAPPTPRRLFVSPNARRLAAELGVDLSRVTGSGPGGRIVGADVMARADSAAMAAEPAPAPPTPTTRGPAAARVTPAARQLAELVGIDLDAVPLRPGSDGRVGREEVAAHLRQRLAAGPPPAAPPLQTPTRVLPWRGVRHTIAQRLHAALQQMAQLTLTMDAGMDAVWADRQARAEQGRAPGFTDYVVAAVGRALRDHPILNSQVVADGIALLPDVHVGLAVALDDGLVVPVVRHADRLGVAAIAAETERLAVAARAGTLALGDVEGGTFSVTSLGSYGVDAFTPVVNPPNVAILGVGRIREDASWDADGLRRVRRATLSLTWDHRVLDGAPAAEFCRTVVRYLEEPASLV